jgi:hypothetical protein
VAAIERGYDPVLFPVGSLARIAAVLKLDLSFVREKARDALGYFPETRIRLADRDVPQVVAACRPYLPRDEEWIALHAEDDEPLDAFAEWDGVE